MDQDLKESRKFRRFTNEDKINYDFSYEVVTKMKFLCSNKERHVPIEEGHSAFVKNISAEGICFVSDQRLEKGDVLDLKVFIPTADDSVIMTGEVRWAKEVSALLETEISDFHDTQGSPSRSRVKFNTGVRLISVNGQDVLNTIYFDEKYHVAWSVVLESVIGKYRILTQKKHEDNE